MEHDTSETIDTSGKCIRVYSVSVYVSAVRIRKMLLRVTMALRGIAKICFFHRTQQN